MLTTKRPGVTSLLVIVGLALLFSGIVAGLTVLSVREQRRSTDTDLSNRALQAAESSAREAAQKLAANPNLEVTKCSDTSTELPPQGSGTQDSSGAEVVCRTVTSTASTIAGQLEKDGNTQVLRGDAMVSQVTVQWATANEGTLSNFAELYPALAGYNQPAMLELSLAYWPKTGANAAFLNDSDASGIKNSTIVLVPSDNTNNKASDSPTTSKNVATTCRNASSPYRCRAVVNLNTLAGLPDGSMGQYNFALRLSSRYAPTNFQMDFFQLTTDNTPATVKNTQAVIDVTAKAGNIYRRVVAEKPIGNLSFVDSVLASGTGICKNLQVTLDPRALSRANECQP